MATARSPVRIALALAAALVVTACLPASLRPTPSAPPSVMPEPTPTLPSPTATRGLPTPTPGPAWVLHTVVRGDTLVSLARAYGTTGRSIAYWNRETYPSLDPESPEYDPNSLQRGWVLRILEGQEYQPPPDDGETGEQVTPEPLDPGDYEEESPPEELESPEEAPVESPAE